MLTTLLLVLDARERLAFHLEPFFLTSRHLVYSYSNVVFVNFIVGFVTFI